MLIKDTMKQFMRTRIRIHDSVVPIKNKNKQLINDPQ